MGEEEPRRLRLLSPSSVFAETEEAQKATRQIAIIFMLYFELFVVSGFDFMMPQRRYFVVCHHKVSWKIILLMKLKLLE